MTLKEEELEKPKIKTAQNILPSLKLDAGFVFLAGSHATCVFPQLAYSVRTASTDAKEHLTPWE